MTVEPITGPGPTGPNILIVDDSAMMRTMIKRVASLAGAPIGTIFEAANGREALAILEQHAVQFVFTDLNMPVMTGTELLREMQARDDWRGIVRIVISTDGSDSRRHEVRALSVAVYVEKPFRPEEMRDVLTSLTPAS
jgi:two-component system chemotaxis response regulator CheY